MVKFFTKAIKSFFKRIKDTHVGYVCDRAARKYNTDCRIQYPSYKTMDDYIDIEKLRSLDSIIIQFIENYLKNPPKHDDRFNTGPFSLKFWHPKVIKSHLVALTVNKSGGLYNYFDLNKSEKWELTDYAKQLPEVIRFIKTLPFEAIGRIMLMFDTGQQSIFPHRDHVSAEMCHEFIWFTANKKKKFYVYHDGLKEYITSYSAWFDTVNQFHGADPAGELNYSIRIDGVFTDEFRKKFHLQRLILLQHLLFGPVWKAKGGSDCLVISSCSDFARLGGCFRDSPAGQGNRYWQTAVGRCLSFRLILDLTTSHRRQFPNFIAYLLTYCRLGQNTPFVLTNKSL